VQLKRHPQHWLKSTAWGVWCDQAGSSNSLGSLERQLLWYLRRNTIEATTLHAACFIGPCHATSCPATANSLLLNKSCLAGLHPANRM
jgi:hypothetical protein